MYGKMKNKSMVMLYNRAKEKNLGLTALRDQLLIEGSITNLRKTLVRVRIEPKNIIMAIVDIKGMFCL